MKSILSKALSDRPNYVGEMLRYVCCVLYALSLSIHLTGKWKKHYIRLNVFLIIQTHSKTFFLAWSSSTIKTNKSKKRTKIEKKNSNEKKNRLKFWFWIGSAIIQREKKIENWDPIAIVCELVEIMPIHKFRYILKTMKIEPKTMPSMCILQ